jgi:hypothetical protein
MRYCAFGRRVAAAFTGLPRGALALGCAALGRRCLGGSRRFAYDGSSRLTVLLEREQPASAVHSSPRVRFQHAVDLTGCACRPSPGDVHSEFRTHRAPSATAPASPLTAASGVAVLPLGENHAKANDGVVLCCCAVVGQPRSARSRRLLMSLGPGRHNR